MDREKVIKGLEMSYTYSNCDDDNTLVPQQLVLDALALLKAQEPRVMTLEEALEADFCWLETHGWHGGDYFAPVLRSQTLDDESGRTFIGKNYDWFGFKDFEYGVTCRCWTSRPTDEQREAVKWDG